MGKFKLLHRTLLGMTRSGCLRYPEFPGSKSSVRTSQHRHDKRQYVTGESYYVWGRRYRLDVQYSSVRNEVSLTGGRLILQVRPESTPGQRERVLNDWYREQLKSKLPEVIQKCEQVVGIHASEWKIKNLKYQKY